jgi:trans-aconitate 2-methyltransferase
VRRSPVLAPEAYALLLDRLGFHEQHVSLRVYAHRLASREGVVEWVQGTTLTAYEERLPAELYADFLARYRGRLVPELEDARPYLFPFKRILLWGGSHAKTE